MTYYIGLPLLFLLALVEAAVLPFFRIFGLQPDIVLVVLLAWVTVRGTEECYILIPIAGALLSLVDSAPFGTAIIALAPVVVLQEMRRLHLGDGQFVLTLAVAVFATMAFHLVYMLAFTITGEPTAWVSAFIRVVLPTCLLNVLVLLPVYGLVWMASGDLRRAAYA